MTEREETVGELPCFAISTSDTGDERACCPWWPPQLDDAFSLAIGDERAAGAPRRARGTASTVGEAAHESHVGEYTPRIRGELSSADERIEDELLCLMTGDGFAFGERLRASHRIGEDLAIGTGLERARGR